MGAVQDIIELYGRGGIEITTYARTEGSDAGQQPLIRTLIQPDASLITWVQPGEETGKALQEHHDQLQNHLQAIKNIRRNLRNIGLAAVLVTTIITFIATGKIDQSLIIRLPVTAAVTFLFGYLFRYLIFFGFRWYIGKKLQEYFPMLSI